MLLSRRRAGKPSITTDKEAAAALASVVVLEQSAQKPSHKKVGYYLVKLLVVLSVVFFLAVLLFFHFSDVANKKKRSQEKNHNVHAVFSQCRIEMGLTTAATAAHSTAQEHAAAHEHSALHHHDYPPCVYLRPSLYFFDPAYPGYQYKQLLDNVASNIRFNTNVWAKQVSMNVLHQNNNVEQPPKEDMEEEEDDNKKKKKKVRHVRRHNVIGTSHPNTFLVQQGITSVSTIMMPKVASRTIDSLFLERLSVQHSGGQQQQQQQGQNHYDYNDPNHHPPFAITTKNTKTTTTTTTTIRSANHHNNFNVFKKGPKVGAATPAFWKQVARRQQEQQQEAKENDEKMHQQEQQQQGRHPYNNNNHKKNHNHYSSDIVFALLRDPVARFLSGVAQTLSAPMRRKWEYKLSLKNNIHPNRTEYWQPCLNQQSSLSSSSSSSSSSFTVLIQCVLHTMKQDEKIQHGTAYFDVHMAPQAAFLAGALGTTNVQVAMFSMADDGLDAIFDAFGGITTTKDNNKKDASSLSSLSLLQQQPPSPPPPPQDLQFQKNKRQAKLFSPAILQRFGTELLDPVKARQAMSVKMIQDVCDLYAVDVDLMNYLGFMTSCNNL